MPGNHTKMIADNQDRPERIRTNVWSAFPYSIKLCQAPSIVCTFITFIQSHGRL